MQASSCSFVRMFRRGAPLARALSVAACVGLATGGCDVGNKPEPPYKDPPPNQRIKSQGLLVLHAGTGCQQLAMVPATPLT